MDTEIEDQIDETEETVEETPETEETESGEGEATSEEGEETEESEEASPGEEEESEENEESEEGEDYKPNLKFKAGVYNKETRQLEQKEYDIDPAFASLMTDAEGEKKVRELHEKAFGLESVKERFTETKNQLAEAQTEVRDIKGSIDGLRNTYQSAVRTGNLHKLDSFFNTLQIPQEVILRYAMAKVELNEMDPAQRNAILGQIQSEEHAERLAQQQEQLQAQTAQQAQELKAQLVEAVLARPEVSELQNLFDERTGKPGSFKQAVYREGMLAWQTEGVDLPPQAAVQRVINNYGLQTPNHGLAKSEQTVAKPGGGKQVIRKATQTIPNVGGNSNSPLAKKPKSMEDVLKYRKQEYGF